MPIDDAEASSLACAFAMDLMSWDADNPERRRLVLSRYRPDLVTGALGWDGRGRQRAEFAIAGRCTRPGDDIHVDVDIRVRIVPYRQLGRLHTPPRARPAATCLGAIPAAAPAPTAWGWEALDSEWMRLSIPVTRDSTGRVVIDFGDIERADDRSPPTGQGGGT